jgi:hypothetical protein
MPVVDPASRCRPVATTTCEGQDMIEFECDGCASLSGYPVGECLNAAGIDMRLRDDGWPDAGDCAT